MLAGKWQSLGARPFPLSDVNLAGRRFTASRGGQTEEQGWISSIGVEGAEGRRERERRIRPSSIYRPISQPGLKFHRPSSARGCFSPLALSPPFHRLLQPRLRNCAHARFRHSIIVPSTGRPDRCPPRTSRSDPRVCLHAMASQLT